MQLDLFEPREPEAAHATAVGPQADDPETVLRRHFDGTQRLPLAALQRAVRDLAAEPHPATAPLLLRVCASYGPWTGSLGPTPEVQAALIGLERLDAVTRRWAVAELARRRPVAPGFMPALLRAEVAAAALPDPEPLRALLANPAAHQRAAACRVAALRGAGRLLDAVRACLDDRVALVRAAAVLSCAELGDDTVRRELERCLESAADANAPATRLIEALGCVADRDSAVVLRRVRPRLAAHDRELADEILADFA
jgi:hypothetical protein